MRTKSYIKEMRSYPHGININEFKYFLKRKNIINLDEIKEIQSQINENKNRVVYWTNETLIQHNIGFLFYSRYNDPDDSRSYRHRRRSEQREKLPEDGDVVVRLIELQDIDERYKISVKDFNNAKLITKDRIFHFLPTEAQYRSMSKLSAEKDNNLISYYYKKRATNLNPVVKTWEEYFNYIISNNLITHYYEYFEDLQETCQELFEEKLECPYEYDLSTDRLREIDIFHIIKVIEKRIKDKNYRIFFIEKPSNRYYNARHYIDIIDETHPYYNLIDEKRFYLQIQRRDDTKFYFFDDNLINGYEKKDSKKLTIPINSDLFSSMINNISNILGDRFIITAQIYRYYAERFPELAKSTTSAEEMAILNKYKEMLSHRKEVKIDNLILTPTSIKVVDQPFFMEFKQKFFDVNENLPLIRNLIRKEDVRYNFNNLYDNIIKNSALKVIYRDNVATSDYKDFEKEEFKLNGMKIKVEKINNRIHINDIFCRIDDVFGILSRAICYMDVDDYNRYIKDVSYIGHEWKKLIGTGVQISITTQINDILQKINERRDEINIRFSFLWNARNRSQIYLYLNGEKYLIRYKNHLKLRIVAPKISLSIKELQELLSESLEEIDDDKIIEIIDNGIKEGEIILEKGRELVEKTAQDINAKEVEMMISGNNRKGYLIIGKVSGAEYFVDKNSLDVFKKVDGNWNRRCVVNDYSKNRIFEDWLANRLVNVFNEPAYIHTLHNV